MFFTICNLFLQKKLDADEISTYNNGKYNTHA